MSRLKRTTGLMLNARQQATLFVEAGLRVLAYALRLNGRKQSSFCFQQSNGGRKTSLTFGNEIVRARVPVEQSLGSFVRISRWQA